MKTFEVDFGAVTLDMGELYRMSGLGDGEPRGEISGFFDRAFAEVAALCRPRFGYEIFPAGDIADRSVGIAGQRFETGRIITPFFEGAAYFALFVATAGAEFDRWLHESRRDGDIMTEFFGDAIGSEIAEAAAREMAARLAKEAAARGLKISNAYSPGYCGWRVDEQRKLFSLLPPAPCGITLNDSCLMAPVKSVSGLIALGPQIEKKPYGCAICNRRECYKKYSTILS